MSGRQGGKLLKHSIMTTCKAVSCYDSADYSWEDYCSYHEKCLDKLREYKSISDIQEIETFETSFNGNCGYVISGSYSYNVWIVVYEPKQWNKSISETLSAIRYKDSYSYLSSARDKARELKGELQNDGWYDTPMLEVHPYANSYESFSSLITSPYVMKNEVGTSNNVLAEAFGPVSYLSPIQLYSGTTPSDLDRHFKPLDIVQVKLVETLSGIRYYHVGIYLGDVDNGKRICHFSRDRNGVRLTSWEGFLEDSVKKIVRYHPVIPFKNPRRIAEQIAWAVETRFREDCYNLRNRNCEHFANMCVYGINYSKQIKDNETRLAAVVGVPGGAVVGGMTAAGGIALGSSLALAPATGGLSLLWGLASAGTAALGGTVTVKICEEVGEMNNSKGSTIKLSNEMSESNNKLDEKDNWLSDQIKANIEVPPKEYCQVM